MLKILEANQAGRCQIQGATMKVKADPNDPQGNVVRLKARFTLQGVADAEAWESLWPGMKAMYRRAVEPESPERWKLRYQGNVELRVEFADDEDESLPFAKGAAVVRQAVVTLSSAAQHVDCELEFGGVPHKALDGFAQALQRTVWIRTSNKQLSLPGMAEENEDDNIPDVI